MGASLIFCHSPAAQRAPLIQGYGSPALAPLVSQPLVRYENFLKLGSVRHKALGPNLSGYPPAILAATEDPVRLEHAVRHTSSVSGNPRHNRLAEHRRHRQSNGQASYETPQLLHTHVSPRKSAETQHFLNLAPRRSRPRQRPRLRTRRRLRSPSYIIYTSYGVTPRYQTVPQRYHFVRTVCHISCT